MREIKFREWLPYTKNMDIVRAIDFEHLTPKESQYLMQYTGRKDKNGKEIYEGDILKRNDYKYSVHWNNYGASFEVGEEGYSLDDGSHYEVIGNIYENKELLK